MRGRRSALTILAALAILAVLGAWLALGTPLFDSPERRVAGYLDATRRGDSNAAMGQWSVFVSERDARFHAPDQLVERRRALTIELASNRAGRGYTVHSTEWWATCCTPRPIEDPRNAGLARVHVTTTGENGKTYKLIFEVWVKDLTYWGDAAGERFQDWRLYEVHEEDQPCVFPNPDFGCIRQIG